MWSDDIDEEDLKLNYLRMANDVTRMWRKMIEETKIHD